MKNWLWVMAAGLAGLGLLTGCGPREESDGSVGPKVYPYRVATTVGMIGDIVRQVAGERATVENIIGEGVDPHLYQATTVDVKTLRAAEVIFYNGLMLEGKMGEVLKKMAGSGKPVHAVTEELAAAEGYVMTTEEQHADPHVWMDVAGWMRAVEVVRRSLAEFDRAHAAEYAANAVAYRDELRALDDYARKAIATIPKSQQVLVTAHDAFGYMARAYGLEVRGLQGISTESKPGVKDVEELVSFLVERRIPAVFVESSVPVKSVQALVEGARAQGHEVRIGGELYSDAMGAAGTYEGTYVGMIDHNVTTIVRALGGDAPAKGLNGKLTHAE